MRRRRTSEATPLIKLFKHPKIVYKAPKSQLKLDLQIFHIFFAHIYKIKFPYFRLLFQDIITICDFMVFSYSRFYINFTHF